MDLVAIYKKHGWIRSAIAISTVNLIILAAVVYIGYFSQKQMNDTNMEERCKEISAAIVGGMTHALSTGDNESVKAQFKRLNHALSGIDVFVYDEKSVISFSTRQEAVGRSFETLLGSRENISRNRNMLRTGDGAGLIRKQAGDKFYYGSLMASRNEASCQSCHSPSKKILGGIAVWVDSSEDFAGMVRARNLSLVIGGIGVLVVVFIVWAIFSRMVRKLSAAWRSVRATSDAVAGHAQKLREASKRIDTRAGKGNKMAGHSAAAAVEISEYITTIASAAEEVSAQINRVNVSSEDVSREISSSSKNITEASGNIGSVAIAAEQMSASVTTVAAAMEQMYASQSEITKSTARCAAITSGAAKEASKTHDVVNKLGSAAVQIGDIIELINGIAGKTNLLALNAAIEAAGAGEAGKGFAVVANEVKALAKQTAGATQDIRRKIEGMQSNTDLAIQAIEAVTNVIGEVDSIISSIASSVEEQTATTNEVTKNVAESADSADAVAKNINIAAEKALEVSQSIRQVTDIEAGVSQNLSQSAKAVGEIAKDVTLSSKRARTVSDNSGRLSRVVNEILESAMSQKDQTDRLAEVSVELKKLTRSFRI